MYVSPQGILGDFKKEQDQWISENREKAKHSEAAVPPWVGYNEEETMKKQILDLSVVSWYMSPSKLFSTMLVRELYYIHIYIYIYRERERERE